MRVHQLLLSLIMLALLTAASVPWAVGAAAQQNNQCFAETGQCVGGRFLDYWRSRGVDMGDQGISARESLALFGYPLTPEFTQTLENGQRYTVQYFERARFEYHPEHAGTDYEVLLGQFGRRILATVPNAPTAPVGPLTDRYAVHFPETGHNVAPDFANYWSRSGGLEVFGYPLSEEFTQRLEDGNTYTVQYFERARFERHPANEGLPYNVQLGHFGRRILAEVPTAPDPGSDNVFATILGPAEAPAGWSVRPCESNGPLLCVSTGGEPVGQIELLILHLETLPNLQALLRQQGLTPDAIDYRDPAHAPKIAAAMRDFVAEHHRNVEEDRRITYGTTRTYTRLATQDAQVGSIPGVRYGFVLTDQAGQVHERYLNYAAFDGTQLYLLVALYAPDSVFAFRSDEELRRFEPYLTRLVAGLRLPLPVETTPVKEVVTQGTVPVFRFYSVGSNPVAEVPAGRTLQVTGQSPNQRWWRVACPNNLAGDCWVSAELTRPRTP